MSTSLSEKDSKSLVIVVIVVAAAILIVTVAFLYNMYFTEPPSQTLLEDPLGDVEYMGEDYPGFIDVTSANLEVDEGLVKLTINMRDSVPEHLDSGEYAQWLTMMILPNGLFKAYEVCMEINSTAVQGDLVGYFREVGEQEEFCTVEHNGNSLTIYAPLEGLESAGEIQYYIETFWFKETVLGLTGTGIDYAPDEGYQSVILD